MVIGSSALAAGGLAGITGLFAALVAFFWLD
jgi:hypothetical protein